MSIVRNDRINALWNDAQVHPEWATTRFWEYLLRTQVFKTEDGTLSSQQPPTDAPGDLRRVDQIVENYSEATHEWTRVLFIELKRADAGLEDLATLERQAFTASCAYLHYFRRERLCSMTAFGGRARLWIYLRGHDYLTPYVPQGDGIGAKDEYLEAHSTEGHLILKGLKYIRDNLVPPANVLRSKSSPRPNNASLPENWHDDEVVHVAGSSFQSNPWSTLNAGSSSIVSSGAYTEQPPGMGVSSQVASSLWVNIWRTDKGRIGFLREKDNKEVETDVSEWQAMSQEYEGLIVTYWVYFGKTSGTEFRTKQDPSAINSKGKGVGKGRTK